ncbi:hypothetical protein E2C01_048018 [Portunus trituberculatus]|uniref:Uncharacterized protein n=1 Tax=Portunus trituberculatus TaxID=210409 RepID=A0A5B7G214_PORTR|nr:hypothetical protein [Portunus trituberculatus]
MSELKLSLQERGTNRDPVILPGDCGTVPRRSLPRSSDLAWGLWDCSPTFSTSLSRRSDLLIHNALNALLPCSTLIRTTMPFDWVVFSLALRRKASTGEEEVPRSGSKFSYEFSDELLYRVCRSSSNQEQEFVPPFRLSVVRHQLVKKRYLAVVRSFPKSFLMNYSTECAVLLATKNKWERKLVILAECRWCCFLPMRAQCQDTSPTRRLEVRFTTTFIGNYLSKGRPTSI